MTTAETARTSVSLSRDVPSEDLARRAANGCAQSFSILAERYRTRLLQVVLGRIGRERIADADDIVQESLTRAWQKMASWEARYRFSTWLFTIALRIAVDHLRRRRRQPQTGERPEPADAGPSVDTVLQQREAVTNLWAVAEQELSEIRFTALWLRYGEGLEVNDVAQALGKTRVGTRVLLHRARTALIPLLEDAPDAPQLSPPPQSVEGGDQ